MPLPEFLDNFSKQLSINGKNLHPIFQKEDFIHRARVPQMPKRIWKTNEVFCNYLKTVNKASELSTKSVRNLTMRMRLAEVCFFKDEFMI